MPNATVTGWKATAGLALNKASEYSSSPTTMPSASISPTMIQPSCLAVDSSDMNLLCMSSCSHVASLGVCWTSDLASAGSGHLLPILPAGPVAASICQPVPKSGRGSQAAKPHCCLFGLCQDPAACRVQHPKHPLAGKSLAQLLW